MNARAMICLGFFCILLFAPSRSVAVDWERVHLLI
jgi:hypothetical protein